jgi:Flp pilus assembly protein TadG
MYMPLLMLAIFLAVQFSLLYLADQAASGIAREAARAARVEGSVAAGQARGHQFARNLGNGLISDVDIRVVQVGPDRMRAEVSGKSQQLVPVLVPRVTAEVEGSIEEFRTDQ